MSENSPIEWTDHTFNPWWGCSKVSPGCDGCYAEALAHRYMPNVKLWALRVDGGVRRLFESEHWGEPLRWNRLAGKRGVRERVFCASMADVFDNHPGVEEPRGELWRLIHKTPNLDWQLLTKRVGNVARMVPTSWLTGHWPAHAWLGISVVNQEEADRDIPKLLALPARVRFLSCEPLLGHIDLWHAHRRIGDFALSAVNYPGGKPLVDWVIAGGESGPKARPMHPDWARALRDQCAHAGVPFLFKQWGEWGPALDADVIDRGEGIGGRLEASGTLSITPNTVQRLGKKAAGRLLDGVQHDGMPA